MSQTAVVIPTFLAFLGAQVLFFILGWVIHWCFHNAPPRKNGCEGER